jgi:lipopolysaccharide/colanic/teichoic acid biosynthesis glycosyltransferase
VFISIILLAFFFPFLVVIFVWIIVDSGGPGIFVQKRVGKGKQLFPILKFRTMKANSANLDFKKEEAFVGDEDPRITKVGKVLRKTSLDELPQLVNVLKGEMSLVGPRPILLEQVDAIDAQFMNRFDVRPGITGPAQINGRRGLNWIDQLEFDSKYAKNPNVFVYIRTLVVTPFKLLSQKNVYGARSGNWRDYLK